jgi:hypothetical protein
VDIGGLYGRFDRATFVGKQKREGEMSNRARKERKRAGIQFVKAAKVGTPPLLRQSNYFRQPPRFAWWVQQHMTQMRKRGEFLSAASQQRKAKRAGWIPGEAERLATARKGKK